MARRSWPLLIVVATTIWLSVVAHSAQASTGVDQQAWAQTGPAPILNAQAGHLYVASTAGEETARSFVHVDIAGASQIDIAAMHLVVTEVSGDSMSLTTPSIAACALARGFVAKDGQVKGTVPPTDCSLRAEATGASDGSWRIDLKVFAHSWTSGPNFGLALFPVIDSPATTTRIAFDATKTQLEGIAPPSAAVSPSINPNTVGPATSAASSLSPASSPALTPSPVSPLPASPAVSPPLLAASSGRGRQAQTPAAPSSRALLPRRTASTPPAFPFFAALVGMAGVAVALRGRVPRRTAGLRSRRSQERVAILGWAAVLAIALAPLLLGEITAYNAGLVLIFIVVALGLHLLVNWAGQLSLAQAGMLGVPALSVAALSEAHGLSPLYLLPVGVALGAATGALIALPALKAQGLQVALVTLTAGIAINRFLLEQGWLVGKSGARHAAIPSLGPLRFSTTKGLYVPLLALTVLTIAFFWMLMHSKIGRAWLWIGANPDAASAFGVPVVAYKIAAYAAAGAFAGMGGTMLVAWVRHLTPQAFPTSLSFTYLLVAVLAGAGFAGGIVLGGLVIAGGPLFFSSASGEVNRAISYLGPIVLIANVTLYKAGFNGAGRALMKKLYESTSTGRRFGPGPIEEDSQLVSGRAGHDRIGLTLIGAVVAIVAGFGAIGLAWYHSGNTNQLWIQNQELISGGVGGLALVLVGVGLLICDQLQRIGSLFGRRQAPPNEPAERPLDAVELADPDRPATNNRRRPLTADRSR
jgi:branched-chain amino acid transport system permease protein